jgi:hypothetical protein
MQALGRTLIVVGILLIAIGGLLYWSKGLPWLGQLPGDIIIRKKNFTFYFPLVTSLLLSAALTLLFYFLNRK